MKKIEYTIQDKVSIKLWEYEDYRDFIQFLLEEKAIKNKKSLASSLGISSTYISRVLNKEAHLSFEQAKELSSLLDLSRYELMALIDKIIISKTEDTELKEIAMERLDWSFNYYGKEQNLKNKEIRKNKTPTPAIYWKLHSLLLNSPKTLLEISKDLNMGPHKVKALLNKAHDYIKIRTIKKDDTVYYEGYLDRSKYKSIDPDEDFAYFHNQEVRQLAGYSHMKRHPIEMADNEQGQHYLAAGFILYLNPEQIENIKIHLQQFAKHVYEMAKSPNKEKDQKSVGLNFDFFDLL